MKSPAREPWFYLDEDDEGALAALESGDRAFVRVLRERAVTWACEPEDTSVLLPEETGFAHLLAVLMPKGPGREVISCVFGAFFDGQGVLGTEVHNQMYLPMVRESAVEVLRVGGSPARCAELTADWFERILRGEAGGRAWV